MNWWRVALSSRRIVELWPANGLNDHDRKNTARTASADKIPSTWLRFCAIISRVLGPEETEILQYLKSFPREFISAKEISRRASTKKRAREEPHWARPFLTRLLNKELIEIDDMGRYRHRQHKRETKKKKWVAPQIAKILEKSGKTFTILEEQIEELPPL
jgi:hypothetical protein